MLTPQELKKSPLFQDIGYENYQQMLDCFQAVQRSYRVDEEMCIRDSPRAAGPQSLRCLQIPLPVPVRGLIITITPPAQQVPPVRPQRFSDIPHIQSQGQDQYITRTAAQGDGLPFQGRLPPLGPLDLVDLFSRGRFSVIEADDRSRCHISAVLLSLIHIFSVAFSFGVPDP